MLIREPYILALSLKLDGDNLRTAFKLYVPRLYESHTKITSAFHMKTIFLKPLNQDDLKAFGDNVFKKIPFL